MRSGAWPGPSYPPGVATFADITEALASELSSPGFELLGCVAVDAYNAALEESLKVFEEGVTLARHCARYLGEAERRIEMLVKDDTGATTTRPFVWEGDETQ